MKGRGILLLGAPGAGEGARAERSRDECGVPHISTGGGFWTAMAEGALVVVDVVERIEEALGR